MRKQNYIFYKKEELFKKSGIYCIKNIINKKLYIGKAKNFYDRLYSHLKLLKSNKHYNPHLQGAVNKYGITNFQFSVLEECCIEELNRKEHYWCNFYNVHDDKFGYNIQPTDPENTYIMTQETKDKISASNKGKIMSEATRKLISLKNSGVKRSEEYKQKLRLFNLGKTLSKEHAEKIGNANRGRKRSEEHKAKLRISRKNLNIVKKCKVIELFSNIEFNSKKEACKYFKISITLVNNNLNNKGHSLNKFKFKRL